MDTILEKISGIPPVVKKKVPLSNIFRDKINSGTFGNSSETFNDILYTLEYLYSRYGKCIYIKILNNEVSTFLPFKNNDYVNCWQWRIVDGFRKGYIYFDEFPVALLDNFLIRDYNFDTDVSWVIQLLKILCENREISDCEFFLNTERKFPMISTNRSVADLGLVATGNLRRNLLDPDMPLKQHVVFSFNKSKDFKDLAFPQEIDFIRTSQNLFGIEDFKSMKWEDKQTEFLYRGYSTGNDTRIKLVEYLQSKNNNIFNVGITSILNLPQMYNGKIVEAPQKNIDVKELPFVELKSTARSKFLFVIDGQGSPEELSTLLFTGSCILKVDSEWCSWYSEYLTPFTHYVPIKSDLSDLDQQIEWCLQNDSKCREIGLNAREFAVRFLSKNGVFDYLQCVLNQKINPVSYENISLTEIQAELQRQYLVQHFSRIEISPITMTKKSLNFKSLKTNAGNRLNWASNAAIGLLFNSLLRLGTEELPVFLRPSFSISPVYTRKYNDLLLGFNHAFIGIKCINELCKEIPNFPYTYYSYLSEMNSLEIYEEKIADSEPVDIFLKKHPGKSQEILIQIFMALQLALEKMFFIHGNLNPRKILVQKLDSPKQIVYHLSEKSYSLITKYVVIITDFSKSKVLSNFSCNTFNKSTRFFIGYFKDDIMLSEKDLTKQLKNTSHDLKSFLKKLSLKEYQERLAEQQGIESKEPIQLMKNIITAEDIRKSKIRFGLLKNPYEPKADEIGNPRLIYDKILDVESPHEKVNERLFTHELPQEKTAIGNVVLKYELVQTLSSTLADISMKFSVDINTSEHLKNSIAFVQNFYNDLIEKTTDVELSADPAVANSTTEFLPDLFGMKMFLKKYLRYYTVKVGKKMALILNSTLRDSLISGINNTIKFYAKYLLVKEKFKKN